MYRLILRELGINNLTKEMQYRIIGCYKTVSRVTINSGSTISVLSETPRRKGTFYYD